MNKKERWKKPLLIRALCDQKKSNNGINRLHTCRSSSGKGGFVRESKEIKEQKANRSRIGKEMQTLTLKEKGRRTHLVLAPLSTAVVRDAPASPLAGARHRTKPPLYRRDAGVRACVLAQQSAVNGKLDGGALTLRRARAPASKPRRRRRVTLLPGQPYGRRRSR